MPECEFGVNDRDLPYNQSWLRHAIPTTNEKFASCSRYAPKDWITAQCSEDMFDAATEITCTEYIHASDERNLQTEVRHHRIECNAVLRTNLSFVLIHRILVQHSLQRQLQARTCRDHWECGALHIFANHRTLVRSLRAIARHGVWHTARIYSCDGQVTLGELLHVYCGKTCSKR